MSIYLENINQAATASAAGAAAADKAKDEVLGKEDFLTLLVAQLQNQDPLNPAEPTEFTAQLAQFSSLEQLFNLNESVDSLVASDANGDRLTTLSTIGKEVAYNGSTFSFDGEPVVVGYQLDGQAAEVNLALQLNGATVATLEGTELGKGNHYLTWDGLTADGQKAAVGDYSIVVTAKAAEGGTIAANPLVRSEVTGVDLEGESGATLITKAGEVAFATILGVYEADTQIANPASSEEKDEKEINNEDTTADITEENKEDVMQEEVTEILSETT